MAVVFLAGMLGGLVRGLVGFIKHQYSYKDVPFSPPYFASMLGLSGLIGVVSALTVQSLGLDILGSSALTPAMAIVVGYAGGDFLENVYKILLKKGKE